MVMVAIDLKQADSAQLLLLWNSSLITCSQVCLHDSAGFAITSAGD